MATQSSSQHKPMSIEERFMAVFNAVTLLILRTPLHPLRSGNTMIIYFTGRKSGRAYRTPVSYTRNGRVLRFFTVRENRWWKNLQEGATTTVLLQGRYHSGTASVSAAPSAQLADDLADHLQQVPRDVKFHNVRWDAPAQVNMDDVRQAAERLVMIHVCLND